MWPGCVWPSFPPAILGANEAPALCGGEEAEPAGEAERVYPPRLSRCPLNPDTQSPTKKSCGTGEGLRGSFLLDALNKSTCVLLMGAQSSVPLVVRAALQSHAVCVHSL